ncbi:cyclin-I isoform X2 [Ictalurus furcatus]|uniref:cyclin-I isoform X2 n=1 Tax=Ictalurus furcatus TaxID=66913 RepID=UPI002350B9A4|nr:cyclin-I isoform X2 [Ictalurus furcatus]
MKFAEPTEGQKLSFLLEKAASREAELWRSYVPKKPASQDTDISPAQRDEAVRWLTDVHRCLKLYPETLCLAISVLDRFLSTIKRIPALRELISSSACGCTPSEVLRMERIVLDKLSWNLHAATPLDFLHIFHAMVFSCKAVSSGILLGLNRSQHLALLTQELLHCLSHNSLLQERGSMLALALVTLQLETLYPDWLALAADLLRKVQIDSSKLIGCRELVARCLSTHTASLPPNTVYVCHPLQTPHDPGVTFHPVLPTLPLRRKPSAKRKVEQMDVDEYFDGIKRLYNEEELGGGGGANSGYQSIEGGSTPCPALQPVTVS